MSSSLESMQATWLAQLEAMRTAIAALNLPSDSQQTAAYGDELDLEDDEFSGTASGDDIWDLLSDDNEEVYSSDHIDYDAAQESSSHASYDQHWLRQQCNLVAQRGSGLDASALTSQVACMLSSDFAAGKSIERFEIERGSKLDDFAALILPYLKAIHQ